MAALVNPSDGLREKKKRDTRHRIAEQGLQLFTVDGYDETTLEAVAVAAHVSARTLFHYFPTKNDILEFWHKQGFEGALHSAIVDGPSIQNPLEAAAKALISVVPQYETRALIKVDRIWQKTPSLRAEKQLAYARLEQLVLSALREYGRSGADEAALHMAAMIVIGGLRLAMELRRGSESHRPLADVVEQLLAMTTRL